MCCQNHRVKMLSLRMAKAEAITMASTAATFSIAMAILTPLQRACLLRFRSQAIRSCSIPNHESKGVSSPLFHENGPSNTSIGCAPPESAFESGGCRIFTTSQTQTFREPAGKNVDRWRTDPFLEKK